MITYARGFTFILSRFIRIRRLGLLMFSPGSLIISTIYLSLTNIAIEKAFLGEEKHQEEKNGT